MSFCGQREYIFSYEMLPALPKYVLVGNNFSNHIFCQGKIL